MFEQMQSASTINAWLEHYLYSMLCSHVYTSWMLHGSCIIPTNVLSQQPQRIQYICQTIYLFQCCTAQFIFKGYIVFQSLGHDPCLAYWGPPRPTDLPQGATHNNCLTLGHLLVFTARRKEALTERKIYPNTSVMLQELNLGPWLTPHYSNSQRVIISNRVVKTYHFNVVYMPYFTKVRWSTQNIFNRISTKMPPKNSHGPQ